MSARMHARLIAAAAGAALLWGVLAPPVLAIGQVVIFRDPVLHKRYAALEAKMTKLQIQNQADQMSAKMRGKKVVCRGVIEDVLPPELTDDGTDACKVIIALTAVTGFNAPELPVITYLVPKNKALALRLRGAVLLSGKLYAMDRFGAVAVELDAPAGWADPLQGGPAPESH